MMRSPAHVAALAVMLAWLVGCSEPEVSPERATLRPMTLVAHAGGGLPHDGGVLDYTNSLEALNLAYRQGHRLFELDFQWTTDRQLVALHDWGENFERLYLADSGPHTRDQFLTLPSRYGLQQLDLAAVLRWLEAHPDSRIVTNIKSHNLAGLALIRRQAGAAQDRFIPQIYEARQWTHARELGYREIIFTLYRSEIRDSMLLRFVADHPLFAVTMPISRARSRLPERLHELGVFTYAHTVDSPAEFAELRSRWHIDGVYTDEILPPGIP